MNHNIAIDGPAGAGKSTIARAVAEKLGHIYVDTGAMYRAMALYAIRSGLDLSDEAAVSAACASADIAIEYRGGEQRVILNGEDVSEAIRAEEVGKAASVVSTYVPVREKMTELQRKLAATVDVVMDGRDIGTVVLPDAACKIFLDASPEERARRRVRQLEEKGETPDFEVILADIKDRDFRDRNRKVAPLKPADDAVVVDTTEMTLQEVIDTLLAFYDDKV